MNTPTRADQLEGARVRAAAAHQHSLHGFRATVGADIDASGWEWSQIGVVWLSALIEGLTLGRCAHLDGVVSAPAFAMPWSSGFLCAACTRDEPLVAALVCRRCGDRDEAQLHLWQVVRGVYVVGFVLCRACVVEVGGSA